MRLSPLVRTIEAPQLIDNNRLETETIDPPIDKMRQP